MFFHMRVTPVLLFSTLSILCSCVQEPDSSESMQEMTDRVFKLASSQCRQMSRALGPQEMPKSYNPKTDEFVKSDIKWWCSGFYPGTLWKVYEYTGDRRMKKLAEQQTFKLSPLKNMDIHNHDIGFMVGCSYGNAYRLTRDTVYLSDIESAAAYLAGRFNPAAGVTLSWEGQFAEKQGWKFPVIIDNMMNLEILMDAWRYFGTDSLKDIAVAHARTTIKNHFRNDFSTWHVVDYDPESGAVRRKQTRQGFSDDSMWARGEAWALYGYTMMFKRSGEDAFLKQAESIASLLEHRLPEDGIPFWDFDCEGEEKDASAAAIMASAFIQLYEIDGNSAHLSIARKQLRTLSGNEYLAKEGTNGGFILKHSVGNKPGGSEIDVSLTYADYYFLEALILYERATSHPRLFLNDKEFKALKSRITSSDDCTLSKMHGMIMKAADSDQTDTVKRIFDESHKRILRQSNLALYRIFSDAYAFRYTSKRDYLDKAVRVLNDVCEFEDWNPSHFLDVAEMAAAVGIGYDWLYDELDDSLRTKAEIAIEKFAFKPSRDTAYAWFYRRKTNWNQVCNGGLAIASLAFREKYDTLAGNVLLKAVSNNSWAMQEIYSSNGNYPEGPGYWGYGNLYQTAMLEGFDSVLGADFGMSCTKGFRQTAQYESMTYGEASQMYNYYDNSAKETPACPLWYFAQRFKEDSFLQKEREFLDKTDYRNNFERFMPLFLLWASRTDELPHEKQPEYQYYSGCGLTPLVMVRGKVPEGRYYLGFKGGSASDNHSHIDGGSFIFDLYGIRWAADLGIVSSYTQVEKELQKSGGNFWKREQNSARWDVFPLGNEWHNTLTINGKRHNVEGRATLVDVYDEPNRKGGRLNMSELFGEADVYRTVTTDGTSVSIEDELSCKNMINVRWTLVTEAEVTLADSCVYLKAGDKQMKLRTNAAACKYSIRDYPRMDELGKTIVDIDFTLPSGNSVIQTKITSL